MGKNGIYKETPTVRQGYFTLKEAAKYLGIGLSTAKREWVRWMEVYGVIPSRFPKRTLKFKQSDLDRMMDAMKVSILSTILFFMSIVNSSAQVVQPALNIDMNKIAMIESSGRPDAVRYKVTRKKVKNKIKVVVDHSVGLYQITPICLKEWNQFHRIKYAMGDLLNPDINRKVAEWYLFVRIPQLLRAFKHPVSVKNVLVAYNAGIGKVGKKKLPKTTVAYLKKYQQLARD